MENEENITELSSIKIFSLFEKEIKRINQYPLTRENLVVQKDAYSRLATTQPFGEAEWDRGFEVFAQLENTRKESDNDFRFVLALADYGFMLNVEDYGEMVFSYDDVFANEEEAARQLVYTLLILANGQFASLHTARKGRLCAIEGLYYAPKTKIPTVLSTDAFYPWYLRKKQTEGYETHLLRNSYDIPHKSMPSRYFLQNTTPNGGPEQSGRELTSGVLTPLTKMLHHETLEQIGQKILEVKNKEEAAARLINNWEFWALLALMVVPIIIFVPEKYSLALPVFGLVAFIVALQFMGYIAGKKYVLKKTNNRMFERIQAIENTIERNLFRIIYCLSLVATFAATFYPIFVDKTSGSLINLYDLMDASSKLILIIPTMLILALCLVIVDTSKKRIFSCLAAIAAVAGLFIANSLLANDDADTPETYTMLAITSFLAVVIMAVVGIVGSVIRLKNPQHTDGPKNLIDL